MSFDAIMAAGAVLLAPVLTTLLALIRPQMRPSRRALIGAAVLPGSAAAICLLVFGGAYFGSPDSCGVDACAMAMMFSLIGLGAAFLVFIVGLVLTHLLHFLLGRLSR